MEGSKKGKAHVATPGQGKFTIQKNRHAALVCKVRAMPACLVITDRRSGHVQGPRGRGYVRGRGGRHAGPPCTLFREVPCGLAMRLPHDIA